MHIRLIQRNKQFSEAEICGMLSDGDLLDYHEAFVPLDFIDSPALRAKYLKELFRPNSEPIGLALAWVKNGGVPPTELHFITPRKPDSKSC
jgi:hypothetical protein